MEKKVSTCVCCKRPFRKPNLPFYNLPEVGLLCVDCADKIDRRYNERGGYRLPKSTKAYIDSILPKIGFETSFEPQDTFPFKVSCIIENHGTTIGLGSLDDVKNLRDALTDFINKCEV